MIRLEAVLIGKVQRVSMRYHCKLTAEKLNLTGVVWNDSDEKRVHLIAEGPKEKLQTLLLEIKNYEYGAINKIEEKWSKPTGEFIGFNIK